jgi:hypothetical protein
MMETPEFAAMYRSASFSAKGWKAVEPAMVMADLGRLQLEIRIVAAADHRNTILSLYGIFAFSFIHGLNISRITL